MHIIPTIHKLFLALRDVPEEDDAVLLDDVRLRLDREVRDEGPVLDHVEELLEVGLDARLDDLEECERGALRLHEEGVRVAPDEDRAGEVDHVHDVVGALLRLRQRDPLLLRALRREVHDELAPDLAAPLLVRLELLRLRVVHEADVVVVKAGEVELGEVRGVDELVEVGELVAAVAIPDVRVPLVAADPAELVAAAAARRGLAGHVVAAAVLLDPRVAPRARLGILRHPLGLESLRVSQLRPLRYDGAVRGRMSILAALPAHPMVAPVAYC